MASTIKFDDKVSCPYNKSHSMIYGRLTKHLERCSRSSANSDEFLVCTFNENHRYKAKELAAHMRECPQRFRWGKEEDKSEEKGMQKPEGENMFKTVVNCEEDWDNEPDVPTYDPTVHCEENKVIRSTVLNGQTKASKRYIRDVERRRFSENR